RPGRETGQHVCRRIAHDRRRHLCRRGRRIRRQVEGGDTRNVRRGRRRTSFEYGARIVDVVRGPDGLAGRKQVYAGTIIGEALIVVAITRRPDGERLRGARRSEERRVGKGGGR